MPGFTFGSSSAPSQITQYFDALFSQSLAKYGKDLGDNISTANPFFYEMKKQGLYKGVNGGTDLRRNLLYGLQSADSYDGYDELNDSPIDGVTQSIWPWRQVAVPISYSLREVLQNREKLIDLVSTKIKQAEMGIAEAWATAFFQGAGGSLISTAKTSAVNGSSWFDPIAKLIAYDPTTSVEIGNINQSTSTWWRNNTKTSAATDLTGLLIEVANLYNTCSKGIGGPPDLMIGDQVTYEALVNAIYLKWRKVDQNDDKNYPFEYTRFKKAKLMWDEKVADAYSNTVTLTYGSLYFINTKFFNISYLNGRDFEMLKDENGKTFAKPLKGDSRLGHMAWMGNVNMNNRRKHGVLVKIARTFNNT